MPRFARISLIAFAAIATSCSSERPQKEAESKEIGRQLTATYYSCEPRDGTALQPMHHEKPTDH
jgi:hypothetical protein